MLFDKVICFLDEGSELSCSFGRLCLIHLPQAIRKVHRSNRQSVRNHVYPFEAKIVDTVEAQEDVQHFHLHLTESMVEQHQIVLPMQKHLPAPEVVNKRMTIDDSDSERIRVRRRLVLPLLNQRLVMKPNAINDARDEIVFQFVRIMVVEHTLQGSVHEIDGVMANLNEDTTLELIWSYTPHHEIICPHFFLSIVGIQANEIPFCQLDHSSALFIGRRLIPENTEFDI